MKKPSLNPRLRWQGDSLVLGGFILLLLIAAVVYVSWQDAYRRIDDKIIASDHEGYARAVLDDKAGRVEGMMREIYQGARTISLLPAVRQIRGPNRPAGADEEWTRARFPKEAEETVRQIYNSLVSHIDVSEVYGVVKGFHPDLSGQGKNGERPFFEIDEAIEANRSVVGNRKDEGGNEAFEYGWLQQELKRQEGLWPRFAFASLDQIPATLSPALVTCDNREGDDPDKARGLVIAVPFYRPSGEFSGMIAVIVREAALLEVLNRVTDHGGEGRFLLARPESNIRIAARDNAALKNLPLDDPSLLQVNLDEAGLPGWRLYYHWDREDMLFDIAQRDDFFLHRAETALIGVAALAAMGFLFRNLRRANRKLREEVLLLKEAQERIGEQEAFLDEAQDAIFALDMEFRIRFWNRAAERLYRIQAREAKGKDIREMLFSRGVGTVPTLVDLFSEGRWEGEMVYKLEEEKPIVVESRWAVLHDAAGKPRGILVVDSDMTEKKGYEAQLNRAQRMENVGALASGVAHDLNNALTPVIVGMQLLEEAKDDEERKALCQTILASAQRGTAMVKQILGFVRGTQGEAGPVQVRHLVDEMVKIIRDTFPKLVTIETKIGKGLWNVCGNATEIHQVLLNLCVNARDAMMPRGGRLIIAAENKVLAARDVMGREGVLPGSFLLLSVIDSGSGIPPHVLPRIFEPLFTTKDPGKGTGLGLSTVAGIVRRMGGFITVESEQGIGTRFLIHLPALTNVPVEEKKGPTAGLPVGKGEKILLVDDDNTVRRLSKVMLENYGYRVVTATNGLEGVSVFNQHEETICLVISDLDMPYMGGVEVMAALRRKRADLPVILISGTEMTDAQLAELEEAKLNSERLGFLIKPYTVEGLIREVARHTGAVPPPVPASPISPLSPLRPATVESVMI